MSEIKLENRDDLLIEALRHADRVSLMLNELSEAVGKRVKGDDDHRFDDLFDILRRRFTDCSGVHLFIAADNLRIDMPPDLNGSPEGETE